MRKSIVIADICLLLLLGLTPLLPRLPVGEARAFGVEGLRDSPTELMGPAQAELAPRPARKATS